MALFYQSGRVSRFAVGTPGFSTNRDLTLSVSGAIGIGTTQPRGSIDTPEISIRGPIIDSGINTGGLGYFLSQDVEGVRWVAASPFDLTFIRVYEDDVQVGVSSFSGLNFRSNDSSLFNIEESAIGPNIADINFNTYWIRTQYDGNAGIATGYGPDGTYASIPGYGTSEAVGVTSVGIGTDNPQDDFQVGVGSTGVTINGRQGKLKAEIIEVDEIELDGNLRAKSLIIDPGISTFFGNIEAYGISSFFGPLTAGIATIEQLKVFDLDADFLRSGITTLGVGIASTTYTVVQNNFESRGNIGTFANDLYVGNDLFVGGEQFVEQLNANNAFITGIATINNIDANTGIFTSIDVTGIGTINELRFNTGVGTDIEAETGRIGILTSDDFTAGFASITDINVSGVATVTKVEVEEIQIEQASVGVLTVRNDLLVTGFSTFIGLTTYIGDVFVQGDLTVTDSFNVTDLGAENLQVTGIGTIVELQSNVGIITTLFTEGQFNTGIATFEDVEASDIQAETGEIGGVGFDSGRVEADFIDADFGRIGILTGDQLNYGIGTFRTGLVSPGISTIAVAIGSNLTYTGLSQINGVGFGSDLTTVNRDLLVTGITTFIGVGTFGEDLYVARDLIVGGTLDFNLITGENLIVSGVSTLNELRFSNGIGTALELDYLKVGVATITSLIGTASTIERMNSRTVSISTDPNQYPDNPGQLYADNAFLRFYNATTGRVDNLTVPQRLIVDNTSTFSGVSTFAQNAFFEQDIDVTGLTTTTFLYAGIGTIEKLDTDFINADEIFAGVTTTRDLIVTGSADFEGDVVVDIGGTANIDEANIDLANIDELNAGIASVGFLTATESFTGLSTIASLVGYSATITFLDLEELDVERINAGITTTQDLVVNGITTLGGFTTTRGGLYVDGDFQVTGVTTIPFVDAEESTVGVLTVRRRLDSNGVAEFENVSISTTLNVTGVTTLGFTTTTDAIVGGALTVVGDTTFLGIVSITDTLFVNQEITGVSTVNRLEFKVGIGTTLSVGILSVADDLYVGGASTFVGVGTFQNNLYVSQDLFVERRIVAAAITAENYFASGISTFNDLDVEGDLDVSDNVGIGSNLIVDGDVLIGGGITFQGDIDIEGNVNVDIEGNINSSGISTFEELRFNVGIGTTLQLEDLIVTGLSSLNNVTANISTTGFSSITDAVIGVGTLGITSTGYLTVGTGSVTDGSFYRTGVGTIIGFTTITGNLFIDGSLEVTQSQIIPQLDAEKATIGILTVTNYAEIDNLIVSNVGFSTLNDFNAQAGIITDLTVGVATITKLEVEDLNVTRNLEVNGISSLGSADPVTGFTTVLSDLYIAGNLYVADDIFKDEIIGRNAYISGVGTINELYVNVGYATEFTIDDLYVGFTSTTDLTAGVGTITVLGVSTANITELNVTGLSSFTDDVFVDANVNITGILTANSIVADGPAGIISATEGTFGQLNADNANIDVLEGQFQETGIVTVTTQLEVPGNINATGINTVNNLETNNLEVSGLTSTTDLNVTDTATIQDLILNGDATFNGEVGISSDVTITDGDLQLTNGDLLVNGYGDFTLGLEVQSGVTTVVDLEAVNVDISGTLNATGINTVDNLNSNQIDVDDIFIDDLRFNTGIGTDLTVTTFQVIEDADFQRNVDVVGITSTGTLDAVTIEVNGFLNATGINTVDQLTSDFITAENLTVTDTLRYDTGIGTDLTLDEATIGEAGITTATITNADITELQVGIATVTTKLDYDDIVSTNAFRATTSGTTTIVSLAPGFKSAEFTITAENATDIHSTKIHAAMRGGNVFWNEYSTVFSTDIATFNVVDNAGNTELEVTATAGLTTFTAYVVAHS